MPRDNLPGSLFNGSLTRREFLRAGGIGAVALLAYPLLQTGCNGRKRRDRVEVLMPAGDRVAVGYSDRATAYPEAPPFDPDVAYPEYPYDAPVNGTQNYAYQLVREALHAWQPQAFGESRWNPLGEVIHPGDRVVIKPNLVWEANFALVWRNGVVTHPAVMRAVIDYVYKACGPRGEIIVCEGTATAELWQPMLRATGVPVVIQHLKEKHNVPVALVDLNQAPRSRALLVRPGSYSSLAAVGGTLYDLHGQPDSYSSTSGRGSCLVAPDVLDADVFISLPKLKVHRMAGASLAMKNMFGIVPAWDGPYGDDRLKDLPHYSEADNRGGTCGRYVDNDTLWRTIADLNRVVLYADRAGVIQDRVQRRYLAILDGLVAGGEDMFSPQPHALGTIIVASSPLAADAVASRIMGYDPLKLKSVANPSRETHLRLGFADAVNIDLRVNGAEHVGAICKAMGPVPPHNPDCSWRGLLETSDTDPPGLDQFQFDARTGEIRVLLRGQDDISWAKIAVQSSRGTETLPMRRVAGSAQAGQWMAQIPPREQPGTVTVQLMDRLFNSSTVSLSLR